MFRLYKAHALPYLERSTPAIFHAHPNSLQLSENVQDMFLEAVSISLKHTLIDLNFAPLSSRRHIGVLGLIHRCQLGFPPPCLANFPQRARSTMCNLSELHPPHDGRVACSVGPNCPMIYRRSIFARVRV